MSAIVAAMSARAWHVKMLRQAGRAIGGPTGAHMLASADYHERRMAAAGRAIVDASNAAGAGRVVEGAPRFDIVGWMRCHRFEYDWAAFGHRGAIGIARHPQRRTDLCPTWLGGTWVWSTAAHDPRSCAWPRPFARGTDR